MGVAEDPVAVLSNGCNMFVTCTFVRTLAHWQRVRCSVTKLVAWSKPGGERSRLGELEIVEPISASLGRGAKRIRAASFVSGSGALVVDGRLSEFVSVWVVQSSGSDDARIVRGQRPGACASGGLPSPRELGKLLGSSTFGCAGVAGQGVRVCGRRTAWSEQRRSTPARSRLDGARWFAL